MRCTVLTIAQQKGGAGKTTLAAHLAVAISQSGLRTAIVDIDPQGSLSRWFQVRTSGTGTEPGEPSEAALLTHSRITGWRTAQEVERLTRSHDVVIIDSPPHAETEAKIAVRAANLVIVPVQPSPMDFWATQPTLDLAAREKRPALLVLNRVPPRGRLADDVAARVAELGAPLATTRIGNRTGLASALMNGRSVTEGRASRAGAEMRALADEVLARARGLPVAA